METLTDPDGVYADVIAKYAAHINPSLAKLMGFAGFGVEMYGEGCYLYDHEGRQLLDFLGGYGVFSLGHRHPKVIEAVKRELDRVPLSSKAFFSRPAADLAARLAELTPSGLEYSFFCNSGAEAVEAALKFAKGSTGRSKLISTEGGYHGKTMGALSVTGRAKYRQRFEPLIPGVQFVEYGDSRAIDAAIDGDTAAVIIEPIQGEGGIIIPPDGYMTNVRRACDRAGALMIVDEVQTGLGRTGKLFACEHEGVTPDLLTLAKCLGGGVMPLAAVCGTAAIWDSIFGQNPLTHTSTFGGGGMACAAGLAALDVIEEEGLVERSRAMGVELVSRLREVQSRHSDLISDVRGRGLMIGVEFALDEVGELVVGQMLKRGMFVAYTLNNPRVLRFEPALILGEPEIERGVTTFEAAVAEVGDLLLSLV